MESASFGLGKSGVLEALAMQKAKVSNISKFQEDIDSVLSSEVSRTVHDSFILKIYIKI